MIIPKFYIAFDGDDTLWPNEINYNYVICDLKRLLSHYGIMQLDDFESELAIRLKDNIPILGYGMKTYIITVIETIADKYNKINNSLISTLLKDVKKYVLPDIIPYKNVAVVLERLSNIYPLLLITKGDLFEQYHKIESSGLKPYFSKIHCVCEKTESTYAEIFATYNITAKQFLMIGNSYQSDILPVVKLGGRAIYIRGEINPYLESIPIPQELSRYNVREINSIQDITPEFIEQYDNR